VETACETCSGGRSTRATLLVLCQLADNSNGGQQGRSLSDYKNIRDAPFSEIDGVGELAASRFQQRFEPQALGREAREVGQVR